MFFSSGEPTPPSVTGGTERGWQPQQPREGPPYYRPQSFNQPFLGYPPNGGMPYGAPGARPYGQPVVPGREPWRIERQTPEVPSQRVPSTEGPSREEGIVALCHFKYCRKVVWDFFPVQKLLLQHEEEGVK